MTDVAANLGAQRLAGEQARHRHTWITNWHWHGDLENRAPEPVIQCVRCNMIQDPAKSRAGRNARKRGNRRELELARSLGGEKVGHHGGPEDVRQGMFNVQSKVRAAFPTWMTTELAKLPRTDGRVPVLIVTSPPGLDPSDRRRRLAIVVVTLDDWRALHGEATP